MPQKFSNNFATTLTAAVTASSTSMPLASVDNLPALGAGDFILLTLENEDASVNEIVKVTGISGNSVTVARGQEGTAPVSWAQGIDVELRITAGAMDYVLTQLDGLEATLAQINGV